MTNNFERIDDSGGIPDVNNSHPQFPNCKNCYEHRERIKRREYPFHDKYPTSFAEITEDERHFVWEWCRVRRLDTVVSVLSLTFWLRCKNSFDPPQFDAKVYMVVCSHLALKWLGYDEVFTMPYLEDLQFEDRTLIPSQHRKIEVEILKALHWDLF